MRTVVVLLSEVLPGAKLCILTQTFAAEGLAYDCLSCSLGSPYLDGAHARSAQ